MKKYICIVLLKSIIEFCPGITQSNSVSLTIYIHSTIKMLPQNDLTYCYLNKTMIIFTRSEAQKNLDGQRPMRDLDNTTKKKREETQKKSRKTSCFASSLKISTGYPQK